MIKRKTLTLTLALAASQQEPTSKPPAQRARVNTAPTTGHDVAVESKLKLPNERDESAAMTPAKPDPVIKQAAADLKHGLQDTSKGLETDQAYKKLK